MLPLNFQLKSKRISLKGITILLIAILAVMACKTLSVDEAPGVGEKAELGYAVCDPIIAAVEQYKIDKGAYPETLEELVPDYLSEVPTEVNNQPISYTKTDSSFSLAFHYIGPGMNTCSYTPENKWKCSGAY